MFANERQKQIYLLLQAQRMATVSEMAKKFDVSETTIRRALEAMEQNGLLKRTHGGAIITDGSCAEPPYLMRAREQYIVKKQMAEIACGLIQDDYLIFMDTSSTVNCMVDSARLSNFSRLTVVSNCIKTVMQLLPFHNITVHCAGGKLRENSNSILGCDAANFISRFNADIAFLSCRGLDPVLGITEADEEEAQLKRALMSRARYKVLLCDATKIGKSYAYAVADIGEYDILITDYLFREQELELLRQKNVQVLCSAEL